MLAALALTCLVSPAIDMYLLILPQEGSTPLIVASQNNHTDTRMTMVR